MGRATPAIAMYWPYIKVLWHPNTFGVASSTAMKSLSSGMTSPKVPLAMLNPMSNKSRATSPLRKHWSLMLSQTRYLHQEQNQLFEYPSSNCPAGPKKSCLSDSLGSSSSTRSTLPQYSSSLSILPLSVVVRSLLMATISSSPYLLTPALGMLSLISNSKSLALSPDRNPFIRYAMAKSVYEHFCAGGSPTEVGERIQQIKALGYSGVILGYAREIVIDDVKASTMDDLEPESRTQGDIQAWKEGTLITVDLAGEGGFVAVKFTGAGKDAVRQLLQGAHPSPILDEAITEICDRAKKRGVRLLVDAEEQAVQPTINEWVLKYSLKYNKGTNGKALIYGTYQAYLRSTPSTLARHLAIAQSEGIILGVKLVRGAYLDTEPRHLIWSTKNETDETYDLLARGLITREDNDLLRGLKKGSKTSPGINLVLASHNRASVQKALKLREEQSRLGHAKIEMAYGQLYGMADDISCDLIRQGKQARDMKPENMETPKVYKALVWGTLSECTKYLLRRGEENRDAASRTEITRKAMARELRRRLQGGH